MRHASVVFTLSFAVLLYTGFLVRYTCFAAGGSDSSGYLNAAKLLAQGDLRVRVGPLDTMRLDNSWRPVFRPLGFAPSPEPRFLVPSYPLGYPLHLAPFGFLGGWAHAPFFVTPLAVLLTLFTVERIARELGLKGDLALAAPLLLAVSPAWLFQALQPMSDVLAAMWCSLAILFALRAERSSRYAVACGVAFAVSAWVRPSSLLLAVAIACAMRFRLRPLTVAVLSSLPLGLALMITNHRLYGSALLTGYGGVGEMVSWSSIAECGPHHAKWLAITLTPLIFPTALLVAFRRSVTGWHRLTLIAWFTAFYAFYSVYPVCDAWWYLRFLLPAFPPLLIGALLVLRDSVRSVAMRRSLVAIVAIAGIALSFHDHIQALRDQEMTYPQAIHWAEGRLPADALVTTMQFSGAWYFYTNKLSVRYDALNPARFEELRAYAGSAGLHWYALVFDAEVQDLERNMPGRWTRLDGMRNVVLLRLDS